jgi:hypothetical protein
VNGEPLGEQHFAVGVAAKGTNPPSQPEDLPHSHGEFDRNPARNLDEWAFHEDVRLEGEHHQEQANATDYEQFAMRFKGLADMGPVEMALAAELIAWAWTPRLAVSDKTRMRGTIVAGRLEREWAKRAPFPSPLAAFRFFVEADPRIGMGTGRSYNIAEDREQDVRARVRAMVLGRQRPEAKDGRQAAGFLPQDFMPAKQTRSAVEGVVGEDKVFLHAVVGQCIDRAGLDPLNLVILRRLRVEGAKAQALADELRKLARIDESAEAIAQRAKRALFALTDQFLERGLVPGTQGRAVRRQRVEAMAPTVLPRVGQ